MGINASRELKKAMWLDYDPNNESIMQDIDYGYIEPYPAPALLAQKQRKDSINPQESTETRDL